MTVKKRAAKTISLTAEQAQLFRQLKKLERQASAGRKAETLAQQTRDQLAAIFGGVEYGETPDKKMILRTSRIVQLKPLPEREFKIAEFHEVPNWRA